MTAANFLAYAGAGHDRRAGLRRSAAPAGAAVTGRSSTRSGGRCWSSACCCRSSSRGSPAAWRSCRLRVAAAGGVSRRRPPPGARAAAAAGRRLGRRRARSPSCRASRCAWPGSRSAWFGCAACGARATDAAIGFDDLQSRRSARRADSVVVRRAASRHLRRAQAGRAAADRARRPPTCRRSAPWSRTSSITSSAATGAGSMAEEIDPFGVLVPSRRCGGWCRASSSRARRWSTSCRSWRPTRAVPISIRSWRSPTTRASPRRPRSRPAVTCSIASCCLSKEGEMSSIRVAVASCALLAALAAGSWERGQCVSAVRRRRRRIRRRRAIPSPLDAHVRRAQEFWEKATKDTSLTREQKLDTDPQGDRGRRPRARDQSRITATR